MKMAPRKAIPKKVRASLWKRDFDSSTAGKCYCCAMNIEALGDWEAGHIVSVKEGGTDTLDNLRPVCKSCNRSMGTENMDAFKARCYGPSPTQSVDDGLPYKTVVINGKVLNLLQRTH